MALAARLRSMLNDLNSFLNDVTSADDSKMEQPRVQETTDMLQRMSLAFMTALQEMDTLRSSWGGSSNSHFIQNPNLFNVGGHVEDAPHISTRDMVDFMTEWVTAYSDRIITE